MRREIRKGHQISAASEVVSHGPTSHPHHQVFIVPRVSRFHDTLAYINHHPDSGERFARYLLLLIIAYF